MTTYNALSEYNLLIGELSNAISTLTEEEDMTVYDYIYTDSAYRKLYRDWALSYDISNDDILECFTLAKYVIAMSLFCNVILSAGKITLQKDRDKDYFEFTNNGCDCGACSGYNYNEIGKGFLVEITLFSASMIGIIAKRIYAINQGKVKLV